ncbi:MAG: UDP-3-O-acyl-N-acetylglucosamine deacetylase, partial [Deltaproteobacteria bacterium]|nr:UDP-3-O-acyl-N-acetylglucosamine deacetylase [Deltaproteobacteria bacterium]
MLQEYGKPFDLIVLDLWLTDGNGLQMIRELKTSYCEHLIVVSSQGDPETIVKCLRLGADHYLEKPLNFEKLSNVLRNLSFSSESTISLSGFIGKKYRPRRGVKTRKTLKRTISQSCMFMGLGIHTGRKFGLRIEPKKNCGIVLSPLESPLEVPLSAFSVSSDKLSTNLKAGDFEVKTVEHLLSSLWGLGITDCHMKAGGEIPVLDGSSMQFAQTLLDAGVETIGEEQEIFVTDTLELNFDDGKAILIEPSEVFSVEYTLEVDGHFISAYYDERMDYLTEIAPARTFAFLRDIEVAHSQDLAQGGRFNNFVLLDGLKPLNTSLRFPNEPARHKILDIIGDLFTTGRRWVCKIEAFKTGHFENNLIAQRLVREYLEEVGS